MCLLDDVGDGREGCAVLALGWAAGWRQPSAQLSLSHVRSRGPWHDNFIQFLLPHALVSQTHTISLSMWPHACGTFILEWSV